MYIILVDNDDEANIKSIIVFLVTYCIMHEEYVNVLLNNKKYRNIHSVSVTTTLT